MIDRIPRMAWWGILFGLTVLVGLLYVLPPLIIYRHFDGEFLINRNSYSDEFLLYAPRAREIADGGFPATEFLSPEQTPPFFNINVFPSLPLGFLVWLSNDINLGYLWAVFLFSGIIFLLFYWIGNFIFRDRAWGILVGLLGILTPVAVHLPRAFLSPDNFLNIVVKNFYPSIRTVLDKLFLARFDDPLLTYPIYLLAIGCLIWFWSKPNRVSAVTAGFFAGLLSYFYFHYWFFWSVVLGLTFLTIIIWNWRTPRFWNFLILIGTSLAVSGPYLVSYLAFRRWPHYFDFLARFNVQFGRDWKFTEAGADMLVYGLLALGVYFFTFRRDRQKAMLFWSILTAAFLVWHTQLIFGYVPSAEHWRKAISPALLIILLNWLSAGYYWWLRGRTRWRTIAAVFLIFLSLLLIVKKVANIYAVQNLPEKTLAEYPYPKEVIQSMAWIHNQLPKSSRIASPSFLTSYHLEVYTSADAVLVPGLLTVASTADLENRFLLINKAFGVKRAVLEKILRGSFSSDCQPDCYPFTNKNLNGGWVDLYVETFRDQETGKNRLPEEKIETLLASYDRLEADWDDLDADYLYFGPWENQLDVNRPDAINLERVYDSGQVAIYRIK